VERRPRVIVFDVNETLSDMAPMASRFADVGAPGLLARVWFSNLLRDGFALTAVHRKEPFARLARGALETVLAGVSLNRPVPAAADHIAGLRTGWITRQPGPYPGYFAPPGLQAPDLGTLARQILS